MHRYLRLVLVVFVLGLLVVALSWPRTGTAQPKAVLTYGLISTGTRKIPAVASAGEDVQVMSQIYDSLLQVDALFNGDPVSQVTLAP